MNNREAITLLRNLEDSLDSYCELNEKGKTAFRMAIEALSCSEFPNSSDTISRQAAIDAADKIIERDTSGSNAVVNAMIAWSEYIRVLPSAQPERKKGKWIIKETAYEDEEAKCSCCGFETLVNQPGNGLHMVNDLHFCPNCGADMRGEAK